MKEIENAIIKSVSISNADHGILTISVHLDYGDSGQSFGQHCLYNPNHKKRDITGWYIWRLFDVIEVDAIKQLEGKPCRVKATYNKVEAIGNYLKDLWFNPEKELEEYRNET